MDLVFRFRRGDGGDDDADVEGRNVIRNRSNNFRNGVRLLFNYDQGEVSDGANSPPPPTTPFIDLMPLGLNA